MTDTPQIGERVWIDDSKYGAREGQWAVVESITPTGRVNAVHRDGGRTFKEQFHNRFGDWVKVGGDAWHPRRMLTGKEATAAAMQADNYHRQGRLRDRLRSLNVPAKADANRLDAIEAAIDALEATLRGEGQ
jgi:hypothetical protein